MHLRNQKCADNQSLNLHKHLTDMMNHIVIHCPEDSLNKLEEISYLIKHGDSLAIEDFLKVNESRLYAHPSTDDTTESTQSIIDDSKKFFKVSLIIYLQFNIYFIRFKLPPTRKEMWCP